MATEFRIDIIVDPTKAASGGAIAKAAVSSVAEAAAAAKAQTDAFSKALTAANAIMDQAASAHAKELSASLNAVGKSFDSVAQAIQREADVLERIKAPQRDYLQNMAALQKLHADGKISADEFTDAEERLNLTHKASASGALGFANGLQAAKDKAGQATVALTLLESAAGASHPTLQKLASDAASIAAGFATAGPLGAVAAGVAAFGDKLDATPPIFKKAASAAESLTAALDAQEESAKNWGVGLEDRLHADHVARDAAAAKKAVDDLGATFHQLTDSQEENAHQIENISALYNQGAVSIERYRAALSAIQVDPMDLDAVRLQAVSAVESQIDAAHVRIQAIQKALATGFGANGAGTAIAVTADGRKALQQDLIKDNADLETLLNGTNKATESMRDAAKAAADLHTQMRAGVTAGIESPDASKPPVARTFDSPQVDLGAAGRGDVIDKLQQEQLAKARDLLKEIRTPADDYAAALAQIRDVQGDLTKGQFDQLVDKAADAFARSKAAAGDFDAQVKLGFLDQLHAATDVSGDISKAFGDAFNGLTDSLTKFVETGKLDFSSLANSIEDDLAKIAVKALEVEALTAIFGGSKAGSFGASVMSAIGFPGHATGADFIVGGNGGTDTSPVAFRATPGERVIVQTPAQQAASAGNGGGAAPVVHVHNHIDSQMMGDYLESDEGSTVIKNIIRKNASAIKTTQG